MFRVFDAFFCVFVSLVCISFFSRRALLRHKTHASSSLLLLCELWCARAVFFLDDDVNDDDRRRLQKSVRPKEGVVVFFSSALFLRVCCLGIVFSEENISDIIVNKNLIEY